MSAIVGVCFDRPINKFYLCSYHQQMKLFITHRKRSETLYQRTNNRHSAFVGDKNISVIKMHGATIKINKFYLGKALAAGSNNHKKHTTTLYEGNSGFLNITAV